MVLPWSARVERCLSFPIRTSRSCAKRKLMKSPFTCLSHMQKGATVAHTNELSPIIVAISPPSWRRIHPLVWTKPLTRHFCKGLHDHTWHIPSATDRSETNSIIFPAFRRIERISTRPDPPSRSDSRGKDAWVDMHTHR